MNKIVSIKTKTNEQVAILVETKAGIVPHRSTIHLVLKYHLIEGMTLTNAAYKRFLQDTEYELLYQKAVVYISYQMRTIAEVKKKLRTSTKDEALLDRIIQELKANQYVGDARYVKEYVHEKMNYDLVGPLYLKDKLVQKGIHFDLIDGELVAYTIDIEYGKIEELLHKELKWPPQKPYYKFVESFKRKCVNKGFHLSAIDSTILNRKDDILARIDEESLLQKELNSYKTPPANYEDKRKRVDSLRRKGYSYQIIQKYLD